jgi:glycosyltransferase involved in cell wall biosynthesis
MLLSIVIPTRNRPELLRGCLESLAAENLDPADTEVTVVDDASEAAAGKENKTQCERVNARLVRLDTRGGAAVARNRGMDLSSGEWIAFLDDDVRVAKGWYCELKGLLARVGDDVAGIEGRVIAEGDGLWDSEVQNENGGLYLTCNAVYRARVLSLVGGFDGHFNAPVPSCEDHELAARVLRWGAVTFDRSIAVAHAARRMNGMRYLFQSPMRIRSQLDAEYYFFSKQRDMYHLFRYRRTFFGTYRAVLFRHAWTSIHRRPTGRLLRHPVQCAVLVCSCILEQAFAWLLLPLFVQRYLTHRGGFFDKDVNLAATALFWRFSDVKPIGAYAVGSSPIHALLFPFIRKPVHSAVPFFNRYVHSGTAHAPARCFLRIDDVFLNDTEAVEGLCELADRKKIPYLAAVIGNHITDGRFAPGLAAIAKSGGDIGLHGFTHKGTFGPFASEILQLPLPRLSALVEEVFRALPEQSRPFLFVPPFNAVSRDQIVYLGRHFRVICGGPETARFTDKIFGPVALLNGSWYFPAYYPFYQRASAILQSRAFSKYGPSGCNICFAVHMADEARNGYKDLAALIDRIAEHLTSWRIFTAEKSAVPTAEEV